MMKEISRKRAILEFISPGIHATCAEVCKWLEKKGLGCSSDSVSSTLAYMVKAGELKYGTKVGPKGGKSYTLAPKKRTFKISFKVPTIHEDHN